MEARHVTIVAPEGGSGGGGSGSGNSGSRAPSRRGSLSAAASPSHAPPPHAAGATTPAAAAKPTSGRGGGASAFAAAAAPSVASSPIGSGGGGGHARLVSGGGGGFGSSHSGGNRAAGRPSAPPIYIPRADAIYLHRQLQLFQRDNSSTAHYGHVPPLPLPNPALVLEDTAQDFSRTQKQGPAVLWPLLEFLRLPKPPGTDLPPGSSGSGSAASSPQGGPVGGAGAAAAPAASNGARTPASVTATAAGNNAAAATAALVRAQDEELAAAGLLERSRQNNIPHAPLPVGAGKAAQAAAAVAARERARPMAQEDLRPLALPDHARSDAAAYPPPPSGPRSLYNPPPTPSLLDFAVPHTVIYEDGQILHWYFSSTGPADLSSAPGSGAGGGATSVPMNTILRKKKANCTPSNILSAFLTSPSSTAQRLTPWQSSRPLDVVATFYPRSVSDLHVVVPIFLGRESLDRFVTARAPRMRVSGVLQAFVAPLGSHNKLLRACWTPSSLEVLERTAGLPLEHPKSRGKGNDVDSRVSTFERNWQAPLSEGALLLDPAWSAEERRRHEERYLDAMLLGNLHAAGVARARAAEAGSAAAAAGGAVGAGAAVSTALASPTTAVASSASALPGTNPSSAALADAQTTPPPKIQTTLAYNEHRITQKSCADAALVQRVHSALWAVVSHLKSVLVRHVKGSANPGEESARPVLPVKLVAYFKVSTGGRLFLLFADEFLASGGNTKMLSRLEAEQNDPARDAMWISASAQQPKQHANAAAIAAAVYGGGGAGAGQGSKSAGKRGSNVSSASSFSGHSNSHSGGYDSDGEQAALAPSSGSGSGPGSLAGSRNNSAPGLRGANRAARTLPGGTATLPSTSAAATGAEPKGALIVTAAKRAPFRANMCLREWSRYLWSFLSGEFVSSRVLGVLELHRQFVREETRAFEAAVAAAQAAAAALAAGGGGGGMGSPGRRGSGAPSMRLSLGATSPPSSASASVPGAGANSLFRRMARDSMLEAESRRAQLRAQQLLSVPPSEQPGSEHPCANCRGLFTLGPDNMLQDMKIPLWEALPRMVAQRLGIMDPAPPAGGSSGGAAAGSSSSSSSRAFSRAARPSSAQSSSAWGSVLSALFPQLTPPRARELLRSKRWLRRTQVVLCEICVLEVRQERAWNAPPSAESASVGTGATTAAATTAATPGHGHGHARAHSFSASSFAAASAAAAAAAPPSYYAPPPLLELSEEVLQALDDSLRDFLQLLSLREPLLLDDDDDQQEEEKEQGQERDASARRISAWPGSGSGTRAGAAAAAGGAGAGEQHHSALDDGRSAQDADAAGDAAASAEEHEADGAAAHPSATTTRKKDRRALRRARRLEAEAVAARELRRQRLEAEAVRWRARALGVPLTPAQLEAEAEAAAEAQEGRAADLQREIERQQRLLDRDREREQAQRPRSGKDAGERSIFFAMNSNSGSGGGATLHPSEHPAHSRSSSSDYGGGGGGGHGGGEREKVNLAAFHRQQEMLRRAAAAAAAAAAAHPQPLSPTSSSSGSAAGGADGHGHGRGAGHGGHHASGGGNGSSGGVTSLFLRNSRQRARDSAAREAAREERAWRRAEQEALREHEERLKSEGTPELRAARAERFRAEQDRRAQARRDAADAAALAALEEARAEESRARRAALAAMQSSRRFGLVPGSTDGGADGSEASSIPRERIPFPMLAAAGSAPRFPPPGLVADYIRETGLPESYLTEYQRAYEGFLAGPAPATAGVEEIPTQQGGKKGNKAQAQAQSHARTMHPSASAPVLPPIGQGRSGRSSASPPRPHHRAPWNARLSPSPSPGATRREVFQAPLVDEALLPLGHANRYDSSHSRPETSLNVYPLGHGPGGVPPRLRSLIRGGGGRVRDEFDEQVEREMAGESRGGAAAAAATATATVDARAPTVLVDPAHALLLAYQPRGHAHAGSSPHLQPLHSTAERDRSPASSSPPRKVSPSSTTTGFGNSPSRTGGASASAGRGRSKGRATSGEHNDSPHPDEHAPAGAQRPPPGIAYALELRQYWLAGHKALSKQERVRQAARYSTEKRREASSSSSPQQQPLQQPSQQGSSGGGDGEDAAEDAGADGQAGQEHEQEQEQEQEQAEEAGPEEQDPSPAAAAAVPADPPTAPAQRSSPSPPRRRAVANTTAAATAPPTKQSKQPKQQPKASTATQKSQPEPKAKPASASAPAPASNPKKSKSKPKAQAKAKSAPVSAPAAPELMDRQLHGVAESAEEGQEEEEQGEEEGQDEQEQEQEEQEQAAEAPLDVDQAEGDDADGDADAEGAERAAACSELLSLFHGADCPFWGEVLAQCDGAFIAELVALTAGLVSSSEDDAANVAPPAPQSLARRALDLLGSIHAAQLGGASSGVESPSDLMRLVRDKARVHNLVHAHAPPMPSAAPSPAASAEPASENDELDIDVDADLADELDPDETAAPAAKKAEASKAGADQPSLKANAPAKAEDAVEDDAAAEPLDEEDYADDSQLQPEPDAADDDETEAQPQSQPAEVENAAPAAAPATLIPQPVVTLESRTDPF